MDTNNYSIDFSFIDCPLIFNNICLYQAGKMFCSPQTVIHSHTHISWFELTVAIEGKGKVYANNECVSIGEGDIFLSFPSDIHKIESDDTSPLKYSFLSFSTTIPLYKEELQSILQNFYDCQQRVFQDPTISYLIELIISNVAEHSFEKETLISIILQTIIILLIRNFSYTKTKTIPSYISQNEILCYKIMHYIDINIFSITNLQELSKQFNYNYSYLANVFSKTTKMTLSQYLANKKLEHSKVLIRENRLSFSEIARLLNYSSLYSFSKSFKKHFGLSPTEYKKSHSPSKTFKE